MRLYDNPFSPFCRKVRLVLNHKGLPYESVDALSLAARGALEAVNPRAEVPALQDGDVTVVNSADIVAYLEHRYPDHPVYPADPAQRAAARAWERLSDTWVDAIVHDISIWVWFTLDRDDSPPEGLIETGVRELRGLYDQLEAALEPEGFLCGTVSIADLALFPHLGGMHAMGVSASPERHPKVLAWGRRLRGLEICRQDLAGVAEHMQQAVSDPTPRYERTRIKWRGDRLEWLLSRGFHAWWLAELEAGRVEWPMVGAAAFPEAIPV